MHGHIKERLGSEFFTDECNADLNKTNVLLAKKKKYRNEVSGYQLAVAAMT